ncbi:MAG: hypothetical protein M1319_06825, partial [Chloroflexi bacterium]|nr:hypothetical protein [Chloroflexota bacterium]
MVIEHCPLKILDRQPIFFELGRYGKAEYCQTSVAGPEIEECIFDDMAGFREIAGSVRLPP